MAAADSSSGERRSRLRRQEFFAEPGRRTLEPTDRDGILTDSRGDPFSPVACEFALTGVVDRAAWGNGADAVTDIDSLWASGDPGRPRQPFQNASTDARDGTSRISVFADKEGIKWLVSVRNRGTGIDSGDTDRPSRLSDRLHSREADDGAGVGPARGRHIIERHGSESGADSESGGGPTVHDGDEATERTPASEAAAADADGDASTDE